MPGGDSPGAAEARGREGSRAALDKCWPPPRRGSQGSGAATVAAGGEGTPDSETTINNEQVPYHGACASGEYLRSNDRTCSVRYKLDRSSGLEGIRERLGKNEVVDNLEQTN